MAQLNPNFEIDFSDINSYEQIQLINDTQLAKENLLMHRAYKEPSDDEIIRNRFSSFTFVDFCPKLLSALRASNVGSNQQVSEQFNSSQNDRAQSPAGSPLPAPLAPSSALGLHYELETFSDLFQRINNWLKLNKDWRVVSMETLVYDCTSQFNHSKSSIHTANLPQNTRGLRLFLSPSKSRFSGPQKIGCINVVPRKLAGSHLSSLLQPNSNNSPDQTIAHETTSPQQETVTYETLDDILQRLNELLLTRPIEGRILSVETITLPMLNGYVNTESNYYVDSRLNLLGQSAYSLAAGLARRQSGAPASTEFGGQLQQASANMLIADPSLHGHTLIDILRVYYEFGPMVCGLVNLIDFVPRFYTPTPVQQAAASQPSETTTTATNPPSVFDSNRQSPTTTSAANNAESSTGGAASRPREKIAATESLTRLIRRSLAWFEMERKRILSETGTNHHDHQTAQTGANSDGQKGGSASSSSSSSSSSSAETGFSKKNAVNLKLCNLQVHQKTLLKSQLVQVNTASSGANGGASSPNNVAQIISTRTMAHPRPNSQQPLSCAQCNLSTDKDPIQSWCSHLNDLNQAYQVKFVRLAYIVPVFNKYARPVCPLRPLRHNRQQAANAIAGGAGAASDQAAMVASGRRTAAAHPSSESGSSSSSPNSSPFSSGQQARRTASPAAEQLSSSDLLQVQATIDWPAEHESGQVVTTAPEQQSLPPPIPAIGPNASIPIDNNNASSAATNLLARVRSESDCSISSRSSSGAGADNLSSSSSGSDAPAHFDDEDQQRLKEFLLNQGKEEESAKQGALEIVRKTNERHHNDEQAHQLQHKSDDGLNDSPIGQLTYRLFAPCQLVNSSSCFSINPVNSSSPLARRGSVDLNGSGISSENANPSTLLLGNSSSTSSSSYQHNESSMSSFGAFFPNLAHDLMHSGGGGAGGAASSGLGCSDLSPSNSKLSSSAAAASSSSSGQLSANSRFTTNEFEPVDAIKRRMEIYVTTNSMKVVAGETLIVNLSDVLSCLSSAIEQTVVKAPFAERAPSTWVSVYVLYAAVGEPQLPSQLLAQQRLRDLTLIDEEVGEEEKAAAATDEMTAECYFDDDFKGSLDISGPAAAAAAAATTTTTTKTSTSANHEQKSQQKPATTAAATKSEPKASTATKSSIRIEQNPVDSSLTLYNSAYDRTVALPTPPDNQQGELVQPIEFLGSQSDSFWLVESALIEAQTRQQSVSQFEAIQKARKGRKAKRRKHDDSQCSIM